MHVSNHLHTFEVNLQVLRQTWMNFSLLFDKSELVSYAEAILKK